jgi:hypothetical protein
MTLLLVNQSPSGTALQFHEFNELRTFCTIRVLHKLCQAVTFEEKGSTMEKCYVPAKHVHPYGYVTFLHRRTSFFAVLPLVILRRA